MRLGMRAILMERRPSALSDPSEDFVTTYFPGMDSRRSTRAPTCGRDDGSTSIGRWGLPPNVEASGRRELCPRLPNSRGYTAGTQPRQNLPTNPYRPSRSGVQDFAAQQRFFGL